MGYPIGGLLSKGAWFAGWPLGLPVGQVERQVEIALRRGEDDGDLGDVVSPQVLPISSRAAYIEGVLEVKRWQ